MKTTTGFTLISLLVILALVAVLGGGYYAYQRNQSDLERQSQSGSAQNPDESAMMGKESMENEENVFIDLIAQNNSGQDGTAEIYDNENGKAVVKIILFDAPEGVLQPAHIHLGSCAKIGTVKYPLANVIDAESEVLLPISTQELLKQLPLAINVHKSSSEGGVYVSCGDIVGDAMMMNDAGEATAEEGTMMDTTKGDGMMNSGVIKTFDLTGKNFSFSQTEIRVKKGDRVLVNFTSTSGTHDWVIDEFNARTARVDGGKSTSVEFTADKTGTFEYYCSVGPHRSLGMKGKLIVE